MHPDDLSVRATPGLARVICLQRPTEVLAVYVRLAFGARDESDDHAGLAHFVEHMIFKGTASRGVGACAAAIEALGGDINAWTSHDEMVLHATVAAGQVSEVLDVLFDMLCDPTFDPHELAKEREVVLEELAASLADPDDLLSSAVSTRLWPGHPYGRPVLGTPQTVAGLQADTLKDALFHAVTADRVSVVVVGEADPSAVCTQVDARLAGTPPHPSRLTSNVYPPLPGVVRPEGAFEDCLVEVTWRLPPPGHPDLPVLSVLAGILSETAGDLLSDALDHPDKVGFDPWSELVFSDAGSSFHLGFRTIPPHTCEALTRVSEVLASLRRGPRGLLVARAREVLLADDAFAEQTADSTAELLLHHESNFSDSRHFWKWREAIQRVSAEDIQNAALRWLPPREAVLGILDPSVSSTAVLDAWQASSRHHTPRKSTSTQLATHIGGFSVLVEPRNVPVMAANLRTTGGASAIPSKHAGLGVAWASMLTRGAGPYDALAFADMLDERSCDLSGVCSANALSIAVSAPASHTTDVLTLLAEPVLSAHFSKDEWLGTRDEMRDALRTRPDNARDMLVDQLAALRYAGHPWAFPDGGTLASLSALHGKTLKTWHEEHFHAPSSVITVTGGVELDDVLASLEWLEDLPQEPSPFALPIPPPWQGGTASLYAGRETASLERWLPAPGRDAPIKSRAAAAIAIALLDGQAGRLFLEVREAQGLAYDVWIAGISHAGHALLMIGATCRPANLDKISLTIDRVLQRLCDEPATAEELHRARRYHLGRGRLASERVEARAAKLARQLLDTDDSDSPQMQQALAEVSAQDVALVIAQALAASRLEVHSLPRTGPTR